MKSIIFAATILVFSSVALNADEFELTENDRVVFLGSEFVEQQIKHNFLEAALTLRWPDRRIQFRNLGWSGDTPTGISRGYFGGADEGFRRLLEELDRIQPTVIFVCYGANSDVESFSKDFARLMGELKKRTERIVSISHPVAEVEHELNIDVTSANLIRAANAKSMKQIVQSDESGRLRFIDLFSRSNQFYVDYYRSDATLESRMGIRFTNDTIRFNEYGYHKWTELSLEELGWPDELIKKHVPKPHAKTHKRLAIEDDSLFNSDRLRELIGEKNSLYFHRYRPQNETYLRGFRKHEQGQNAKEIEEFDALIKMAEDRIFAFVNGHPIPAAVAEPEPIALTFEAFSPDQERESFTLAEGLNINLFASEPMVANPIHMNFDSRGRLWVATSPIYPHIKPGAKPRDEIVILEDTDGDGRADKRTVFADDLLIPTAVLPDERGGAYVANSTEILHLRDTNGDGKADERRVLLAGFGTEDTHHIVHTFRWGPDAAIYFNQSIYIHTHMETPRGVRRLMGSGIWRFDPQNGDARVLMRGLVNPWGHVFDEWGQSFATDGAGGDGINYAFPTAAYATAFGFSKVLRGMNPGQPKLCGLEIFSGNHFPEDWNQTLATNDFRGNRINRFQLSPFESGYTSKQLPDLLSSNHRAFRPVDLKQAPDGSLFVADWYNPIINHGEIDFRDSRRDYKHGRIWRVTANDRALSNRPITDFQSATTDELIGLMNSGGNQWTESMARVELKQRVANHQLHFDGEFREQVMTLIDSKDSRTQLAGLWTMQACGGFEIDAIEKGLGSSDHRVRAATVRIISTLLTLKDQSNLLDQVRPLVVAATHDPHPQVRLESVNAWRSVCSPDSFVSLLNLLDHPLDQYLEFGLVNALKDTRENWISTLSATDLEPAKLHFVLENIDSPETVALIFDALEKESDPERSMKLIRMVGQRGTEADLKRIWELAIKKKEVQSATLNVLVTAAEKRKIRLRIEPDALERLFDNPMAIRLAGEWKIVPLQSRLIAIASGEEARPNDYRVAAINGLAAMRDGNTLNSIALASSNSNSLRRECVIRLASIDTRKAAIAAAILVSSFADDEPGMALLTDPFFKRKGGGELFGLAIAENKPTAELLATLLKKAANAGDEGKSFTNAIGTSANIKMKAKLSPEEIAALVIRVESSGNAERGELIYRRENLNCMKCHAIGGAGGVVGPDLISLGASSPVDYIVQSLVEPDAKIKEGYHTTKILTDDGILISGKLMSEADGKVVLRDADDKEHVIAQSEIEEMKISSTSLMPVDTISSLSQTEFIDLAAFLVALGKEGPFKVSNERLVRRWIDEQGVAHFSRVDGSLPASEFAGKTISFELNVTNPGTIGVEVENPDGLRITLNGMSDNLRAQRIVKDLPIGRHRFKFKIGQKRESLRVKLFEIDGSSANVEIVRQ